MADYIHGRQHIDSGDTVKVDCDTQCNVMLLSDNDFSSYKAGRSYNYHGGFYKHFPALITVPRNGFWNVVLDLGGGSAQIRYEINVIKS